MADENYNPFLITFSEGESESNPEDSDWDPVLMPFGPDFNSEKNQSLSAEKNLENENLKSEQKTDDFVSGHFLKEEKNDFSDLKIEQEKTDGFLKKEPLNNQSTPEKNDLNSGLEKKSDNNVSEISSDVFKPEEISEKIGPIKEAVYLIEVNKIRPNSQQPRREFNPDSLRELADSIREYGILQPLVLTKIENDTQTGTSVFYELIAGERRWRAAQMLGLERVPAIVRRPLAERQKLEAAVIENVQRSNLNPLETARAYAKLADEFGLPQREIAQKIGVSRESVANSMRLLQLPSEAQRALQEGRISESHARVILTLQNPEKQRGLLGEILSGHLTVRETEALAKRFVSGGEINLKNNPLAAFENAIEAEIRSRLEQALGTKVEIKKKGDRGKITITFFSEDELKEILKRICPE